MPYKLIQAVVLLPGVIYLWIRLTSPETALENQWAARFVIVIFGLCALGTLAYFLNVKQAVLIPSQTLDNGELKSYLTDQINDLKKEIVSLKAAPTPIPDLSGQTNANNLLDVLSATDKPTKQSIGTLQINSEADLNVYKEANKVSEVVGVALHGTNYEYFEKINNWYLIDFDGEEMGWITSSDITEVNISP